MSRFERVVLRDEAMQDLRALAERSRTLTVEVFRLLKQLDAGELTPVPLHDYAKSGDLRDCGKIVVALEGEPEHRIVVRDVGGHFLVSEVIAVDDRSGDLPYLLAGLRLGRLDDAVRRSEAQRRIARLRRYQLARTRPPGNSAIRRMVRASANWLLRSRSIPTPPACRGGTGHDGPMPRPRPASRAATIA